MREYLARARELMEDLSDRRGHALLTWEAAAVAEVEGHLDEADTLYGVARTLFAAVGDSQYAASPRDQELSAPEIHGAVV